MADVKKVNWKYWGSLAVIGFVSYFAGKWLARTGLDSYPDVMDALTPSIMAAMAAGALYFVMGIVLIFAVALPKIGAPVLSGVDDEDIRDQRALFVSQAAAALAFGIALIALAGAGSAGIFTTSTGGTIFAIAIIFGAVCYIVSWPKMDELLRDSTVEAAAISYGLTVLGIGSWAALGHLGLAAEPGLLDIVTSFWIVALVASVWAGARRGMLTS